MRPAPKNQSNNAEFAPRRASMMSKQRLAVVYLARTLEGAAPLRSFIESYLRHPAGVAHDLVVIYKGCEKRNELNVARGIFASLPHTAIDLPDDGFDINAYLVAAQRLNHEYVCFLNTFTEIAAPNWLATLYKCALSPGVGIAGAMGSYESLSDSFALINKVIWLCRHVEIDYDENLAHFYAFVIEFNCKIWKARGEGRRISALAVLAARVKARLSLLKKLASPGEILRPAPRHGSLDAEFRRIWARLTEPGRIYSGYTRFPPFPNPHIRSNGFLIARHRMLGFEPSEVKTKLDSCLFESGIDGLTNRIRRDQLGACVVDRFGNSYPIADWSRGKTFRLGGQEGLLLTDTRSRQFDAMPPGTRETHARMTWGDYIGPPPADFPSLGFKFPITR